MGLKECSGGKQRLGRVQRQEGRMADDPHEVRINCTDTAGQGAETWTPQDPGEGAGWAKIQKR